VKAYATRKNAIMVTHEFCSVKTSIVKILPTSFSSIPITEKSYGILARIAYFNIMVVCVAEKRDLRE